MQMVLRQAERDGERARRGDAAASSNQPERRAPWKQQTTAAGGGVMHDTIRGRDILEMLFD